MASSQVEIVSSSPFGCVLKDQSHRRDRCRERTSEAAFQKNLNELVRDHLHNCICVSADQNSQNQSNNEQRSQHNHRNLSFLTNNQSKKNDNQDGNAHQSLIMNSSQSRILDCWAAKQALEKVSTTEKQSEEAELLGAPSSSRTTNPPPDGLENSVPETEILGASSLVQIWEARLNRSYSMNNNLNPSWTSSGLSNTENMSPTGVEMGDSIEAKLENSFSDWETQSDRTAVTISGPPTARNSDAGESERVRIADIIKRLTSSSDHNENETESNLCVSPSPSREQRGLTQVVTSPKIRVRGRQAFADLLLQMERDRNRELHSLQECQAVSKFPQRGRIQSLLRLRFLRGMASRDQDPPQSSGSPLNRLPLGSSIMQLREKFGTGIGNGDTTQSNATCWSNSGMEMAPTRTVNQDDSSTTNRLSENDGIQQVADGERQGSPRTVDDAQQGTSSGYTLLDSQGTGETTVHLNVSDGIEIGEDQKEADQGNSETRAILDDRNENEPAYKEQQQQQQFLHPQETATFLNNWYENEVEVSDAEAEEEEESYGHHHFEDNNNDWITEISRPRSHWDNLRQAWYQERLSSGTENDEICQLIQRKRVSTFLSSDFRDTMDQLMASRAMTHADINGYREEEDEATQERMSRLLLPHLRRQERDQVVEEEEEEERNSLNHQFHEASHYFESSSSIQMPSPSMITTWSFRDDSDPVASPSPQPSPSQTYDQDSRRSPDPANRLSIEMELVYDLRGQMQQLHSEMAELRKSLQSCVEMQVKMQHSNQQEVHSVTVMPNNPLVGAPNKRICCMCYEMQVDSLLYRCGHMCTCLKCAHELQWSSGKCPICRAPIDDVVRAYMDA